MNGDVGMPGPDDRMERVPERVPTFGEEADGHISLHAVRVSDGKAHFEQSGDSAGLLVWVAVTHAADGARAYTGLAVASRDTALRGRIALDELDTNARQALRQALLLEDPDAWDRADDKVQEALDEGKGKGR